MIVTNIMQKYDDDYVFKCAINCCCTFVLSICVIISMAIYIESVNDTPKWIPNDNCIVTNYE